MWISRIYQEFENFSFGAENERINRKPFWKIETISLRTENIKIWKGRSRRTARHVVNYTDAGLNARNRPECRCGRMLVRENKTTLRIGGKGGEGEEAAV